MKSVTDICPRPNCLVCQAVGKYHLSQREVHVIALICRGLSTGQMVKALQLSRDTVNSHLRHIFDKTGCGTKLEVAMWAIHQRMVRI